MKQLCYDFIQTSKLFENQKPNSARFTIKIFQMKSVLKKFKE